MRRISTPLLTLLAVAFSTAAFSQTVTLSDTVDIPVSESRVTGGPVLTKDNMGNVFQAAINHPAGGSTLGTLIVAKYNTSGSPLWIIPYPHPGLDDQEATAITTDRSGNVIVTGSYKAFLLNGSTDTEAITLKFDPAGYLLWDVRTRLGTSVTAPTCITTDTSGNIYIGGTVRNSAVADSADFFLLRLNSSGSQVWSRTYNGTAGKADQVTAIAAQPSGNIFITGASKGQMKVFVQGRDAPSIAQTGYDYATLKYSAGGELFWAARYATLVDDIPTAMTLDAAGNVYVTGSSNRLGTTVCYNNAGTQQWALSSTAALNNTSIALDPSGNVVTAGYSINAGNLFYTVTKCTAAGALSWSTNTGTGPYVPFNLAPNPKVAVDHQSHIYVSGEAVPLGSGAPQNLKFAVYKYTPAGALELNLFYNDPSGLGDVPTNIALIEPASPGPLNYPTIYVGGFTYITRSSAVFDLTLITYTQTVTIFHLSNKTDTATANPESLASTLIPTLSNYPNPFHGVTNIAYTLAHPSHVTLQLFDAKGRTIATLLNADEPTGTHTLPFNATRLAPGVYAYRIAATAPQGNFTATKQMIIQ